MLNIKYLLLLNNNIYLHIKYSIQDTLQVLV